MVLLRARALKRVTVSWLDTTDTGDQEAKARILEPLGMLKGRASVEIGLVDGNKMTEADVDPIWFEKALREVFAGSACVGIKHGHLEMT